MNFTQAMVDAQNEKVLRGRGKVLASEGDQELRREMLCKMERAIREKDIHNDIQRYCEDRGWIALHGSMAHRAFRVCGEFDFCILATGGRVFFIEVKTPIGKLSTAQQNLHAQAMHLGHKPKVVRSMEEFLEVVK